MAKVRIFISSTFYDLKQIRVELDKFITGMGYEAIRHEMGDVPYGKDEKIEEDCYKEIPEVDILIGIIGGRYGSQSKHESYSVSQTEIRTALEQNKQVYIFIDKNVYTEFEIYKLNNGNKKIKYRYSDNYKIFEFLKELEVLTKNNNTHHFETAEDITSYLREQWAGRFKRLLNHEQQQIQLNTLSSQLRELSDLSTTLKRYLEAVMQGVSQNQSDVAKVITEETERLDYQKKLSDLSSIEFMRHLRSAHKIRYEDLLSALCSIESFSEFKEEIFRLSAKKNMLAFLNDKECIEDINLARQKIGREPYKIQDGE